MDDYERQIIKNSYQNLSQALKDLENQLLITNPLLNPCLHSAKCRIIDAMANLEQTGIFERDALLKDPSVSREIDE